MSFTFHHDNRSVPVSADPCLTHRNHGSQCLGHSTGTFKLEALTLKSQWRWPKLQTLVLICPPSSTFCLNWLKGRPYIKTLRLTALNQPPNILLCQHNKPTTLSAPSTAQLSTSQARLRSEKLPSITLESPSVISEDAYLTLLVKYAANVNELHMEEIDNDPYGEGE
ncbi:MAG: hypothetical protein BYD32DRAFT_465616 [Podila humilis]|nr:MAG: hypothetical protein BYD32DRAFT_465616 [Podila humilis]